MQAHEMSVALTLFPRCLILRSGVYPNTPGAARSIAGHAGPPHLAHPDLRTAAWTCDRSRHQAHVGGRAARRTWRALSGAPASRGARLDCGEMGRLVEQPQSTLLFPDRRR